MRWTSEELKAKGFNPDGTRMAGAKGDEGSYPIFPVETAPQPRPPISTDEEGLNKTEKAFLEYLRRTYPHTAVHVHSITLKLADDTRYTCDFYRWMGGVLEGYEVKGFFRDDAKVKIKVAARMFPHIRFYLVTKIRAGEWSVNPVKP